MQSPVEPVFGAKTLPSVGGMEKFKGGMMRAGDLVPWHVPKGASRAGALSTAEDVQST